MQTVTLEEAQSRLATLVEHLLPGEEVVITRDDKRVAKLISAALGQRHPRKAGSAKGQLTILSDDDEHLKDFAEYS